ncbi:MAG: pilus assembly protein [Bauldia sp.]|uniref:TadE/TadG family type IV pilus assembly protein n=1 Tax=Bauldia sp. TaxID=2575872 RepID=UPI001DD803D4|nr:TadE/TadG family type IV pilus assembly protein [Bauldia sp.]MCB1495484.1 pilus assembly protein [Bauldia sp.]
MAIFNRLARDESGNVAVVFALALIPLFGAVGALIDYTRVSNLRAEVAAAIDAGLLAVGSQPPMSDQQAFDTVNKWLETHIKPTYQGNWKLDSVVQQKGGKITATVSGAIDTTIAKVLGVQSIPISVTSEIVSAVGKVEVAMVLDNTGSMATKNKIGKLKDAAEALVDTLAKAVLDPSDLKIGLVPFSQTVNVGPNYKDAAWLDKDGKSDSAKSLFLGQEVNRLDLFKAMGTTWGGCVETRFGYEASETPADSAKPNTLYVPFFAPDEPGIAGEGDNGKKNNGTSPPYDYNNSYLDDTPLGTIKADLATKGLNDALTLPDYRLLEGDILKYAGSPTPYEGTTDSLKYDYGPNSGCEMAPIMRLTTNTAEAKTAINKMIANGNTDIPIGASWGWNVLSDKGPFGDGVAYGTEDWTKIMVLMTDGNNENQTGNELNESIYSGLGYVWQEKMGVPADNKNKSARTAARDDKLSEICTAMKAKGIVIYTVRVETNNGMPSDPVMKACATQPDYYYEVNDVSKMVAAFEDIGNSIQKLRLAR